MIRTVSGERVACSPFETGLMITQDDTEYDGQDNVCNHLRDIQEQ